MNAIGYSIFGANKHHQDCFSFQSYLRGLSLNLRMASLIYPFWHIHIAVDRPTYESEYRPFFDYHKENHSQIHISVVEEQPLCLMMLQRLLPIFTGYDRVICRDIDSLITYRERQAVEYWIKTGRVCGAITDSISHTIPLMGGMVSFISDGFRKRLGVDSFDSLIQLDSSIDFTKKGDDQLFLNRIVLPKVEDSLVEHYVLGLKQSFRGECFNYIQDDPIEDIAPVLKESNLLVNHIGQSGFSETHALKFFDKYLTGSQKDYFNRADQLLPDIFYWVREM